MFARLFADSGLSLDRLRALVEVGAAGSIVGAAGADPVRQSQLSRQIKELEDFFGVRLTERQGKTLRLTPGGKELARISRFFLLGLSNFHRGTLAQEQHFRIAAIPTLIDQILLPVIAGRPAQHTSYATESAQGADIERRLHDLTLDFGIVHEPTLSRPLQLLEIGAYTMIAWVPGRLWGRSPFHAGAVQAGKLPLALAEKELIPAFRAWPGAVPPRVACDTFLEARTLLETGRFATVLPDFLVPRPSSTIYLSAPMPGTDVADVRLSLAWNPRMMRLNTHAVRERDALASSLSAALSALPRHTGRPSRTRPS